LFWADSRVADGRPASDRKAVEKAVADLIRALALDERADPELRDTPARVASFYEEAFAGLAAIEEPELAVFPAGESADQLVVVRELPFYSLCVHHFAPFFGHATIAYLPGASLIGISGPARLLDWASRRPQLQERLGQEIAEQLERRLAPRGLAVILEARHLCMEMRGIRRRGQVETRLVRGALAEPRFAEALRSRG
jgi:GTP cyclohydrolase I